MKKVLSILSIFCIFSLNAQSAENWKGHTEATPYEFGVLTGLSLYGTETGWGFLGNAAYLIKPNGLVDDIDERVWLEIQAGPSFFSAPSGSTGTGFQYSTHARWDFTYNEYWTAYGLGGLGGYITPGYLGSKFTIHPRFAVGVEYQTKSALMFRGEVSAEFTGVGVALNF